MSPIYRSHTPGERTWSIGRKVFSAIKVLNGLKYKQGWKLILKNSGRSMKWKELAVNRMLSVMIKRRANTFFMIVQRKVLKAAEVFVTTAKRWTQGKNINRKTALLI